MGSEPRLPLVHYSSELLSVVYSYWLTVETLIQVLCCTWLPCITSRPLSWPKYCCITGEIKDGILRIGNTRVAVHNPDTKMKVPDVLFYENAQVSVR